LGKECIKTKSNPKEFGVFVASPSPWFIFLFFCATDIFPFVLKKTKGIWGFCSGFHVNVYSPKDLPHLLSWIKPHFILGHVILIGHSLDPYYL
jgi:hypothetical protein